MLLTLFLFSGLYPARAGNLNRVGNFTIFFHENKTDGIDLTDGLKGNDIEKLEDLNK